MVLLQFVLYFLVFEIAIHGEGHHLVAVLLHCHPGQTGLGFAHTASIPEFDQPPVVFSDDVADVTLMVEDTAHTRSVQLRVGLDQAPVGFDGREQRIFGGGQTERHVADLRQRLPLDVLFFPGRFQPQLLFARECAVDHGPALFLHPYVGRGA